MAHLAKKLFTSEKYFEIEFNATEKHEYFDGDIVNMFRANMAHNRLVANVIGELHAYLKGKECSEFPSDVRVTTPLSDAYMYPDITIVCGEPVLEDDRFDTLTNPSVIIEVMSESTKENDKGYKFFRYLQIPSLKEYIRIDTERYEITTARKQNNDLWEFIYTNGKDEILTIKTINMQLPLADIYYRVTLNTLSK